MPFSKTRLAFMSAALGLLVVSPAAAIKKPTTNAFSVRGHGLFTMSTNPTCSCLVYQGSLSGLNTTPFGKNVSLSWTLFQGNKISSTPNGGTVFSVDGDGTFSDGSSQENITWAGTSSFFESFAFFKLAAALSPGNSAGAQLFGLIDASIVLDLDTHTAFYEWDGNAGD